MMKPDCQAPFFQQQFVTATPRVGRGFAVVEQHLALRMSRRLHPKRDRERVSPGEVSNARKDEAVFAIQLRRHSVFALDQ